MRENEWLESVAATAICSEVEEVAAGLARLVAAQLEANGLAVVQPDGERPSTVRPESD